MVVAEATASGPGAVPAAAASATPGTGSPLIVLETGGGGHRWRYVATVVDDAAEQGRSVVVVTTQDAVSRQEYDTFAAESLRRAAARTVLVPPVAGGRSRVRMVLRLRRDLAAELAQGGVLAVPDGDHWIGPVLAAWPKRRRVRVLVMRPALPGQRTTVTRKVKWAVTRAAGTLLPGTVGGLVSPLHPLAGSRIGGVLMVPDPPDVPPLLSRDEARARLGLDARPVLLVCGAIDRRKSIAELLEWAAQHQGEWRLALAGRFTPAARELLDAHLARHGEAGMRNVLVEDRFLSAEELGTWVSSADCIAVMHENEGSSGIQLTAAAAGVPVLGWGAQDVRAGIDAGVGGAWLEARSPQAIERGVQRAVGSARRDHDALGLDAQRFIDFLT